MAESEANRFIVRVVADVWIYPLSKGSLTFSAKRKTEELLDQLQFLCTGHHTIDLLALQDEIRTMHVSTDTITQYIGALEKAQLKAARAEMLIPVNYLMMVATKAMLSSECFPRDNEDWEDLEKVSKSWTKWCELYNKADMRETIRIQEGGKEAEQFGSAALGGAVRGKEPRSGRPTPATVEYLEGCFDSLAGVVVTGKGVLEELVKSYVYLTITIYTFTDSNTRLAKKVETLTEALAKKGGGRVEVTDRGPGKHCPNCKR